MGVFRLAGKLIALTGAAVVGAAIGDLARQRFTNEKGQMFSRSATGEWTINVPPQLLIPAVIAGFRGGERGILRAAATGAMMGATGGKGPAGFAQQFFKRRKQ